MTAPESRGRHPTPTGRRRIHWICAGIIACSPSALPPGAAGSDHADPLVLNPLDPPRLNEPRLTDLHVFLDSDASGEPNNPQALVVSLCAFPSLPPLATGGKGGRALPPELDLADYRYSIHIDLDAGLSFDDQADLERYGGTVEVPADIAPSISFTVELDDDATLKAVRTVGLRKPRIVTEAPFQAGAINVRTGIFDDPFIFPQFFRTNVVGIVLSIPLDLFPKNQRQFLIWATSTRDGRQVDHAGRAQRTQLPRFELLNTLPPSRHAAEIRRRHQTPTLAEDVLQTMFSPLFGHRHFDAAPDVVIFDTERPTRFPNGRKLDDDVAPILARWGDAQLLETAYAEDPRFPRVETNDRPFLDEFPYLAPPWTAAEVAANPLPFHRHRPTLTDSSWRILWFVAIGAATLLTLLLLAALRHKVARIAVAALYIALFWWLFPVFSKNLPDDDRSARAMAQPARKFHRLATGGGAVALLSLAWIYALGRRHGARRPDPEAHLPQGRQGLSGDDRQYTGSTYEAIRDEVIGHPYYEVWGGRDERSLPVYPVTFRSLAKGLLRGRRRHPFSQAQSRTLKSAADMRWGQDGKGVRRLLHPNGVCLAGTWEIDASPEDTQYSGAFKPGTRARIIARYSTCCTETRGGNWRSLSMVGKLFPDGPGRPAHFFAQEDLGGTCTDSVREAVLTNSPPVSIWRRGKGVFSFLITVATFMRADKKPAERQLYEIAELGEGGETRCPRFIRLTVSEGAPEVGGTGLDFREEILDMIYDRGDPAPKRELVFDVAVSDKGERTGRLVQRLRKQEWTRIGKVTFTEAAASYNGDFVIHFRHPPWRDDRNDPGSVSRPELADD